MHFVFVTGNYPSAVERNSGTFVRQFILAVARQGHRCTVINPTRWLARRFGPLPPRREIDRADAVDLPVLRPRMLSFSMKRVGPFRAARLTQAAFNGAVLRGMRQLDQPASVCYGHFLYQAGYAALRAAEFLRVPAIAAVGEGTLWTVEPMGFARAKKQLQGMAGFLAVSSLLKEVLQQSLELPAAKIGIFPNGVDLSLFHPRDQFAMRVKYGLANGPFKLAFVGAFDELKGVARLVEAVRGIEGVQLLLIGKGKVQVHSDQIAFQGVVEHSQVPELLSAADVFVLPTCEEGSCNAVIEAMACGLPIVTSNGPYMDDLINDQVAIRVDPMDVGALRAAVLHLVQNPERRRALAAASLIRARAFNVNDRARRVVEWIRRVGNVQEVDPAPTVCLPVPAGTEANRASSP